MAVATQMPNSITTGHGLRCLGGAHAQTFLKPINGFIWRGGNRAANKCRLDVVLTTTPKKTAYKLLNQEKLLNNVLLLLLFLKRECKHKQTKQTKLVKPLLAWRCVF
jgi:hypothetical protein